MSGTRIRPSERPGHALITGGAGFIGSHLSEALLERGDAVTVVDDLSSGSHDNIAHLTSHPRYRFVNERVENEDVVDEIARECDVIFHLAATVGVQLIVNDPLRVIETNIMGTRTILRVANRHRRRVLIASTSEVYGKNDRVPFNEDDDRVLGPTTKARWSYSCSKAVDEFLGLAFHQRFGLPTIIFRLFNTVGPRQTGQYGMVLPRFVQQAILGEPLTVYGDGLQTRCFCDVEDAVRAIVGLADSPSAVGRVFNVGSTNEISMVDLARKILKLVDETTPGNPTSEAQDARIVFVPYDEAYGAGFEDMRRRVPDISRIRATIGWAPRVSLDETLRRVNAYFREFRPALSRQDGVGQEEVRQALAGGPGAPRMARRSWK